MRVLGADPKEPRNLTREEAFRAFGAILGGGESEILTGAFLISLRWKGVTVEELMGFAQAARAQAKIPCQGMEGLVCLCPQHDGHERFPPLDVCAGLIAAAAGARVLILSDRCVPPRRGLTAASVLEAMGLSMTWDPSEAEDWGRQGPLRGRRHLGHAARVDRASTCARRRDRAHAPLDGREAPGSAERCGADGRAERPGCSASPSR